MRSRADTESRPLSVKEINELAYKFDWNTGISLKHWLRTTQTLYNEGEIYLREGNFAQAYLIYLRYSILVMEYLYSHPEAKTPEGKRPLRPLVSGLKIVLDNLEKIKPIIDRDHEEWLKAESMKLTARERLQTHQNDSDAQKSLYERHAYTDPALSSATQLLDASENQDLAVDLAQKEIQRRDADRKATRRAGVSHQEEQHRRIAGIWDNWATELADRQAEEESTFRQQMESTRRRLDGDEDRELAGLSHETRLAQTDGVRITNQRVAMPSNYSYPSISKFQPVEYEAKPLSPREEPRSQPPRPPKEDFELIDPRLTSYTPIVPSKKPLIPERTLPRPEQSLQIPEPPPKVRDASAGPAKKQPRRTFRPAAYLENGEPIRPVFLPSELRQRFLSIAAPNTKRGLEMCGILCGTAVNNALFVRCLLIPEQKCTSDTCETVNEGTMLDYCMTEDLLVLGWIHTHPTQTCFMSSRDLHTQSGYQVMLPESIAIVCAPRFEPSYGIFRLTNPPGLPHLLECTRPGTFHQHSVDNLYTDAGNPPGHVYESEKLDFYVKDLRPGAYNGAVQNKNI
ncbi:hypothetical protein F5Y15DRAFT_366458 [Xylariaceae sp. FL0016]|nr:hypothetical protein F5Y15DRAFT_366458 [Xylariaceae sp. FL0016]